MLKISANLIELFLSIPFAEVTILNPIINNLQK
jgi:hypothetical protein